MRFNQHSESWQTWWIFHPHSEIWQTWWNLTWNFLQKYEFWLWEWYKNPYPTGLSSIWHSGNAVSNLYLTSARFWTLFCNPVVSLEWVWSPWHRHRSSPSNLNIWKDPDADLLSRFQVESVCGNSNQIATHNVDILLIQPMTNVKEFWESIRSNQMHYLSVIGLQFGL